MEKSNKILSTPLLHLLSRYFFCCFLNWNEKQKKKKKKWREKKELNLIKTSNHLIVVWKRFLSAIVPDRSANTTICCFSVGDCVLRCTLGTHRRSHPICAAAASWMAANIRRDRAQPIIVRSSNRNEIKSNDLFFYFWKRPRTPSLVDCLAINLFIFSIIIRFVYTLIFHRRQLATMSNKLVRSHAS